MVTSEQPLITDATLETVAALEQCADDLARVCIDNYRWKWVLLALHSSLQGMMVVALQGSDGLRPLKPEDAKRWLEAFDDGTECPDDLKLDDFLALYEKTKGPAMDLYSTSRRFRPAGSQGGSVKKLNRLRNEFVHFTPRVFVLFLSELPRMCLDCLQVVEFLGWESGNITWHESTLEKRARRAIESSSHVLATMGAGRSVARLGNSPSLRTVGTYEVKPSSTTPGFINAQQQRVIRRLRPSTTFAGQYLYELQCDRIGPAGKRCGHLYAANGCDIAGAGAGSGRLCPACQDGAPGEAVDV